MESVNQIIDSLKSYELHDMPVAGLELRTDPTAQLILHLLAYDENTKDYNRIYLSFIEINKLESSPLNITATSSLEISQFDYQYEDGFVCTLVLLLGFGEPSLTIDLSCQTIDISSE